ncbi:MAG TPA: hypothetical protein VKT77_22380 [Chthonomonadaceae bacterium]|nr:hypothetical protein [Chthonomonadaceae bacterium]
MRPLFIASLALIAGSVIGSGAAAPSFAQDPPAKEAAVAPKTFAYGDFRIVPVRVHLLRDSDTKAAITSLTEKDIARVFAKANGIWHAAGVHLWVESIVSEKPASVAGHEKDASLPTQALLALRPEDSRPAGMFHVYYIGDMSPNGIFMRRDAIFVKQSARLRPVKGGIDEPLPRVTAHELGHGMGLPHRQDTYNLLASGTTGTSLNDTEIDIVRRNLETKPWVETPEQFLKQAELATGEKRADAARTMYLALRDIPGDSPVKQAAAKRLTAE